MPSVSKNPGVTAYQSAAPECLLLHERPSFDVEAPVAGGHRQRQSARRAGGLHARAATRAAVEQALEVSRSTSGRPGYRASGSEIRSVSTRSLTNPDGTAISLAKLLISRPGADQQHHRERHLRDDQRRAGSRRARRFRACPSSTDRARAIAGHLQRRE